MAFETKVGSSGFLDQKLGSKTTSIERQIQEYEELSAKYKFITMEKVHKYEKTLINKREKEEFEHAKKLADQMNKDLESGFSKTIKSVTKAFLNLGNTLGSSIDSYINTYTQYMGKITTRLQGSGMDFNMLAKNVAKNLGTSPYLKQTDMLTNLNKFVETGISYNLETRAYIATATDKIATTFDAFDASLLRLIRIQQADSTIQRLGMESLLTKFLNEHYGDTSYLTKGGLSTSVTSNLLEAEALMGYKGATSFEYTIQKGLGMMSSLGVSSNTINAIAQGLGYLGSGNISAISGNTALQNLLVMAASRAGLPFGNLLTQGVSSSNAADLLSAIVGLGQDIAKSGNNVVMSQYANIFGLTVSDLISLTNVTTKDLKAITSDLVTYEQLTKETQEQLYTMSKRTTTSEMVQNVLSNIMTGLGANIATNPIMYGIWEVANLMHNSGLDPKINLGFLGTGTSFDTSTLMKTGLIGVSSIMSIANALGNLQNGSGLGGNNLNMWSSYSERRGRGLTSQGGVSHGVDKSGIAMIGSLDSSALSTSSGDIKKETETYTGDQEDDEMTITIRDNIQPDVHAILDVLRKFAQGMGVIGVY